MDDGWGWEWEWEWEGVFENAVVNPLCCLHSFSDCIRDFIGTVPSDVAVASRIHHWDINPQRLGTDDNWEQRGDYPLWSNEICTGSGAGISFKVDGLVGQAKAFLRIVSDGPLDLIVAAHAKWCVNVKVASMKGAVARAVYGVTLASELRVRRILNRPCTELRSEGAAKLFSREQPLILNISVRLHKADPGWGAAEHPCSFTQRFCLEGIVNIGRVCGLRFPFCNTKFATEIMLSMISLQSCSLVLRTSLAEH